MTAREARAEKMAKDFGFESILCFERSLYAHDDIEMSGRITYKRTDIPYFVHFADAKWKVCYQFPRFPKYLEEPNYVEGEFCASLAEAEKSLLDNMEQLRSGLAIAHNITLKVQEELHGRPGRPVE